MGKDKPVASIDFADVQLYSDARKKGYRDERKEYQAVGASTITKER